LTEDGDEIVTFEPFYDSYAAMIALSRATHVTVPLHAPQFQPDLDDLRAAVTDRTRIILINNPHNPTGTVLSAETLACIVELAHKHNAIIVSDEVYEHLTFGVPHIPICTIPGARERTVTISSGGKTFNTTGWKIGWLSAPAEIVEAVIAVKQFLTYVGGAPFQPAIAVGLGLPDSYFTTAAAILAAKRDMLSAGLVTAGFTVFSPQGGYFVVADAAPLGFADAAELCRELPALAGVVGIPVTAFVREGNRADYRSMIRFAYCKRVNILTMASAQLAALSVRH
jgi:N-succinyldiaminopimelate aminotransferase